MSLEIKTSLGKISSEQVTVSAGSKLDIKSQSVSIKNAGSSIITFTSADNATITGYNGLTVDSQGNINFGFNSNVITLYGESILLNPTNTLTLGVTTYPKTGGTNGQVLINNGSNALVWGNVATGITEVSADSKYSKLSQPVLNVAGATIIDNSKNHNIVVVSGVSVLTVAASGWSASNTFSVIAKGNAAGSTIVPEAPLIINHAGSAPSITFDAGFTGIQIVFVSPLSAYAIGRLA